MLFGKKKKGLSAFEGPPEGEGELSPEVFETLEGLEKAGAQLSVRFTRTSAYASTILGLGRDGFFIDTLSPPSGDRNAVEGRPVEIESLLDGVKVLFRSKVAGKVAFLDDMPAFKIAYPKALIKEQRRKTNRLDTHGTARLSFVGPFACDAEVVNIGDGGLAFEYNAELGRLKPGVRLSDARLFLGSFGLVDIKGEVVGSLVASLGGLSLPSTYRTGLRFILLTEGGRARLADYIKSLES